MMIGNLSFITISQESFLGAVLAETTFRFFIDISKISTQMGNSRMDFGLVKKTLPSAFLFAALRDFISRGCFWHLNSQLLTELDSWVKKNSSNRFHIFFGCAIVATLLSHPFDVMFTKLASQRSYRYEGIKTPYNILKGEGVMKLFFSGA